MILFKPEHVQPILDGTKTQTRRMGQKRWNVGAVHQCKTSIFGTTSMPFARVRILAVEREHLIDISDADVVAEGYADRHAYLRAFVRINSRQSAVQSEAALVELANRIDVWVVRFELAEAVAA